MPVDTRNHALLERAMLLAFRAHEGQTRKDAPTPYIVHPFEVGLILARYGFSDVVIAAALVHDTVEDTPVTLEDVRRELGDEVAAIVAPVTHDDTLSWEDKKRAYIEAVRAASEAAKAVSVADKIANAHSLLAAYAREGTAVWRHFNRGRDKKIWFENAMCAMLKETWMHPLVEEYARLVDEMNTLPG